MLTAVALAGAVSALKGTPSMPPEGIQVYGPSQYPSAGAVGAWVAALALASVGVAAVALTVWPRSRRRR